ncbi:MAG: murein hydrolase activator EnvC [Actinomycetota bacterium]
MRTRRITWPAIVCLTMALAVIPLAKPAWALTANDVQRQINHLRDELGKLSNQLDIAGQQLWSAQQAVITHNKALQDAQRQKALLRRAIGSQAAQLYMLGGDVPLAIGDNVTQIADQITYLQEVDLGSRQTLEEIQALDARAKTESTALAAALKRARALELQVQHQRALVADRLGQLTSLFNFLRSIDPSFGGPVRGMWCPVAGPHIELNNYGEPRPSGPHTGDDIDAPYGTPVRAVLPGTITEVVHGGWMGLGIIMRDLAGNEFWYAHLSASYTHTGARVGGGEVFGRVGCSGNCTGPHLHFEFHPNGGAPANPHRIVISVC